MNDALIIAPPPAYITAASTPSAQARAHEIAVITWVSIPISSAESINDDIGIRPCLCRIIERLKRYEFRIAEHKGSSAEEQRYKTHCDDLLAKLVNIASLAEHQQIDEKADCHAYGHTDKHADIHRYSPIIQTISNNIASKSSYRCLRKISCGGCSENKSHSKGR